MEVNFYLESDIQKLIDCDALELYIKGDVLLIPYMMNDAVECYFKFEGCNIYGKWDKKFSGETTIDIVNNDGKNGLIIHQGYDNVVTIWYKNVNKYLELYQYHRIAHLWVKGNEKWRRLVYIVGTIYDKLNFLGPEYSNPEEIQLADLMGFAPFRYWTPINESLDDYYSDTSAGLAAIMNLAVSIKDEKLLAKLQQYSADFVDGKLNMSKIKKFANFLSKDLEIYRVIDSLIEKASVNYKCRNYSDQELERLEKMRLQAMEKFRMKGYVGSYPELVKGKHRVTFYEEHPYVIQDFEYDNFDFKINVIEEKI